MTPAKWFHALPDGRVQCDLCPRFCKLHEGQRGFCFVAAREGDEVVLTTYGRSSGFCVDPIEKKPLAHFFPGTSVLSFGTAGCNLGCKFCQNWDISKSREQRPARRRAPARGHRRGPPGNLAAESVAFTYNDPVIFAEYAIDVGRACREQGIKTVAVTAGYMYAEPRAEFYRYMDAANVDLKAFTDDSTASCRAGAARSRCSRRSQYLKHETAVWFEITTLLIPGENDSDAELDELTRGSPRSSGPMCRCTSPRFIPTTRCGHPAHAARDAAPRARDRAAPKGCGTSTRATSTTARARRRPVPGCGTAVIVRDWYEIVESRVDRGACAVCGK